MLTLEIRFVRVLLLLAVMATTKPILVVLCSLLPTESAQEGWWLYSTNGSSPHLSCVWNSQVSEEQLLSGPVEPFYNKSSTRRLEDVFARFPGWPFLITPALHQLCFLASAVSSFLSLLECRGQPTLLVLQQVWSAVRPYTSNSQTRLYDVYV